jgi:hypothetical protein
MCWIPSKHIDRKGKIMRIPTGEERKFVLNKLREAVVMQIAMWDAAGEISEALDCDLTEVLTVVNANAIVAGDGTDVSDGDLDELLGIAPLIPSIAP